jgi:hypothetical protein
VERAAAEGEVERLNRDHPERDKFQWVAMPHRDAWAVVKTRRGSRVDPLKATTEAKPKPPQQEDPRSALQRDVRGYS